MLFLVNSSGVPSVAAFVQVVSAPRPQALTSCRRIGPSTVQASNSSVSVGYSNAQTAGDLNIVAVGWGDTTSTISSVTDSGGNTYTRAVGPTTTTGLQQVIYYAKNIAGGGNTVTVKFSQAASYPDVRILEYSGLDTSSPLDVTAAGVGWDQRQQRLCHHDFGERVDLRLRDDGRAPPSPAAGVGIHHPFD